MLCRNSILGALSNAGPLNRHRILIITRRFRNRLRVITARNFKFSRRLHTTRHTHSIIPSHIKDMVSRHSMRTTLILVQVRRNRRTSRRHTNSRRRRVRTHTNHSTKHSNPRRMRRIRQVLRNNAMARSKRHTRRTGQSRSIHTSNRYSRTNRRTRTRRHRHRTTQVRSTHMRPPMCTMSSSTRRRHRRRNRHRFKRIMLTRKIRRQFLSRIICTRNFTFSFTVIQLLHFLQLPVFSTTHFHPSIFNLPQCIQPIHSDRALNAFRPSYR